MNTNDIQKLKKAFEDSRLSASEKASMRANLMRLIEQKTSAFPQKASPSFYSFSFLRSVRVPVTLMLLFLVGGSTSLAAAGSLPGELLYPVKVNVNEKVAVMLAVNTEAKAEVHARHVVERLSEAKRLVEKGKLTPQTNAILNVNYTAGATALDRDLEKLNKSGNYKAVAKINGDIEADLDVHLKDLYELSKENGATSTSSAPIARAIVRSVSLRRESAKEKKERAEVKEVGAGSSAVARAAAESIRLQVLAFASSTKESLVQSRELDLSSSAMLEAKVLLKQADWLIVEGDRKVTSGSYAEAYSSFKRALRLLQEAKSKIDLKARDSQKKEEMEQREREIDFEWDKERYQNWPTKQKEEDKQDNSRRDRKESENNKNSENKKENSIDLPTIVPAAVRAL